VNTRDVLTLIKPKVPVVPEQAVHYTAVILERLNENSSILAETVADFLTQQQQDRWLARYFPKN